MSTRIERAWPGALGLLQAIELAAAALFREADLPAPLRGRVMSLEHLGEARRAGRLWVALSPEAEPIGFAVVDLEGGVPHLCEIDVHPEQARRGIGRALIRAVVAWARESGHAQLTLTTYRHVVWNAPFYARIGFRVLGPSELSPALARVLAHEAASGLDPARRVAMRLELVAPPAAEEVLDFWLGSATSSPAEARARTTFWFASDATTDTEIARRFGPRVSQAGAGELADWTDHPRASLARVILLDQFPRNIHRGDAKAFALDAQALAASRQALAARHLADLWIAERGFLLMPHQHAEDLAAQREGVAHYEALAAQAPAGWREVTASFLDSARRHLELIERFGRFPHRNAILDRPSRAEERAFLAAGGESFGQSPAAR